MPIHPYLTGGTFEPEYIAAVSLAFQEVCEALEIGPRATREREVIAVRIIELARRGEQPEAHDRLQTARRRTPQLPRFVAGTLR